MIGGSPVRAASPGPPGGHQSITCATTSVLNKLAPTKHRRVAYDTFRSVSSTPAVAVRRRPKYDRRLACPGGLAESARWSPVHHLRYDLSAYQAGPDNTQPSPPCHFT